MPWKRMTFTIDQIEDEGVLSELENEFENIFMDAKGPSDMAIFSDNDYVDESISFYFTPGCEPDCEDLILRHDGEECEPPDIEEVFLFAGNDDAIDLLV